MIPTCMEMMRPDHPQRTAGQNSQISRMNLGFFLFWLEMGLHASTVRTFSDCDFYQEGDYLIGGLFNLHSVGNALYHDRPEAINCSSESLVLANYRRFQLMRFAVGEINNSSALLPDVYLGYELYDHCSESYSFPDIFHLMSVNRTIRPWAKPSKLQMRKPSGSPAIAVVGPFTSTQTFSVAPLLMVDLVPMVSYGATGSDFSEHSKFPSFLRTIPPNKDAIEGIVNILQHFDWRWVAFLNSDNDFGIDGLELFRRKIENTDICLAYTKGLVDNMDHSQIFKQIEAQNVQIIIVFAPKTYTEPFITSAVRQNITNRVWIADDGWSLDKEISKMRGIQNIGTVLGVAQPVVPIAGFKDFLLLRSAQGCGHEGREQRLCNQVCNSRSIDAEDVDAADPSFSFPVYSAIYVIAHALHNTLQCEIGRCNKSIKAYPHKVLAEMKKSNFTLLNHTIQFDENGDPRFGSYSIVVWNSSGDAQEIGFYQFYPKVYSHINDTKIQWHDNGKVPKSFCSPECQVGFAKKQSGIHKCCFTCRICRNGTYINTTEDPYSCKPCSEAEWSAEGSTRCNLRTVEYVAFTDPAALTLITITGVLVGLTLAVCVLFALHYNTPVVRSAGGPMCFLILGCLSLSSISVFFYFGRPSVAFCIFRFFPFLLFYTVCVSCFVVRSFQIVCIFKIAAKIPKLQSWWVRYHGQWVVITVAFVIQAVLLLIGYSLDLPTPHNETFWYPDKTILNCNMNLKAMSVSVIFLLTLCSLCFVFSYMGKDLPKNYNEAKSITFCLLLLVLTWIIFATEYMLYHGKHILTLNAMAVLCSLFSFLLCYFLPKCYIIIFHPQKNTQQHFQGLIQSYTKTISQ